MAASPQKCTCNSLHLAFDLCGGEA
ncbi:hypothetical protein [Escherichia coli]